MGQLRRATNLKTRLAIWLQAPTRMILTKRASRTQWPNTTRERLPRNLATEDKVTEKIEEEEITEEEEVAVMVIERITEDQEPNLVNTTTIEDKVATETVTEEETI